MNYEDLMFANTLEKQIALDLILILYYDLRNVEIFDREDLVGLLFSEIELPAEGIFWRQSFLRVNKKFVDLILSSKPIKGHLLNKFRHGGK